MKPSPAVIVTLLLAAAIATAPARAADASAGINATLGTPSSTDRGFIDNATTSGATEIEAGRLALLQANSNAVKNFARTMVSDHEKLSRQLQDVLLSQGITSPQNGPDVNLIAQLKQLKGSEFDKAYIQQAALQAHKDAVALFAIESQNGQNEALRQLARQALPTIQHHLEMAKKLPGANKMNMAQ
jgi:putative membrane protein